MTRCKKCGTEVTWVKSDNRWMCLNADSTDHWDSCSKNVWEDVKKHGEEFTRKKGKEIVTGYRSVKHGEKAAMRSGIVITGKKYKPVIHADTCSVMPWENCACA